MVVSFSNNLCWIYTFPHLENNWSSSSLPSVLKLAHCNTFITKQSVYRIENSGRRRPLAGPVCQTWVAKFSWIGQSRAGIVSPAHNSTIIIISHTRRDTCCKFLYIHGISYITQYLTRLRSPRAGGPFNYWLYIYCYISLYRARTPIELQVGRIPLLSLAQ